MTYDALASTKDSADIFYIDSGASYHLIPSQGGLHAYQKFAMPIEISAANGNKIYAYSSGDLRVATLANGLESEAVLQDVFYAPEVHARLISLGKLQRQGWEIRIWDGGMELRNQDGHKVADVEMVNDVYLMMLDVIPPEVALAAWARGVAGPTHEELIERLGAVALVATAKGPDGMRVTLWTWHRRLGHPAFKMVLALAQSGASGMVITDVPAVVPSLDACAACVAAKAIHLPHKEGRSRASEYLERVHIDIVSPMPTKSVGGREYAYYVVDDYTRAVHTKPLQLKSSRLRVVMTDNAHKLSMGEVREICEQDGIKLHTTVTYHPASNGVAERAIGVLTNAARALRPPGFPVG